MFVMNWLWTHISGYELTFHDLQVLHAGGRTGPSAPMLSVFSCHFRFDPMDWPLADIRAHPGEARSARLYCMVLHFQNLDIVPKSAEFNDLFKYCICVVYINNYRLRVLLVLLILVVSNA